MAPYLYFDLSFKRLREVAKLIADDLTSHKDQSWTEIDTRYELDPAAVITTFDLT